ncbi:hypothetical protein [Mesobacillus harenae]|uniref:hypothetical protein n=1 Tax=Mesobacillus harenae TaxID=2213203 RepID=UPI0015812A90|nr:hypothetical protein [Mesobacillus harenae]
MLNIQKDSMQEVLMILQNIGLQLNEYEKNHNTISVESYKDLLDFSISIARRTNSVSETIDELLDDVQKKLSL